ncbi:MAG TPA: phosphate ABC transporter permease subunit PstC [Thermoleophilia bacterium]|nr:phosphate ABC transporter permease subunit PstC [Thermoleophilia bacterium]
MTGQATDTRPIQDTPPDAATEASGGRRLRLGDPVFRIIATACGITVAVAMFGLVVVLVYDSWPAISTLGTEVLTTVAWSPIDGKYGVLAALAGTVLSTLIAMVIAVPLALVIALLLVELVHPTVARVVGTGIEMLAAIPSIVFGMVGIFVVVPFMQDTLVPWILATPLGSIPGIAPGPKFQGGGVSIFTAGVILAFMVLPFITAVSRDVLSMVPRVTKESGYGMGSTTWEVMRKISMPYANSGIVGGVFIGFGRALGETMAVAYLIGSLYTDLPRSIFDPGTSIASLIAQQFAEATDEVQVSALIELGLILFVITMAFQVLAQVWLRREKRSTGGRA